MNLICSLSFRTKIGMTSMSKKGKNNTYTELLKMVEKIIRGGIYHAIYQYTKVNNKYMEEYNPNKDS